MLKKVTRKISFAAALVLLPSLLCTSAFAAEIADMAVDVPNHQGKYIADNLIDGDPHTAWVGGGKGIGPGKYIEIDFPSPVALESLRIHNGHQGKGQFDKFRRLTRGVILYPDGTRQKFILKPVSGEQEISLKPVTASSIKIIITGVAPSSKDKAMGKAKVAVSEIKVYGTLGKGGEAASGETEIDVKLAKQGDGAAALDAEEAASPKPAVSVKKEKPKPVKKDKVSLNPKKAEPASKPRKAKPAPVTKSKPVTKPKPEIKPVVKKSAPKKKAQKPAPKKVAPKKKAKRAPSASQPGITRLRASVPVPVDMPMDSGVISPWLDLEFVAQIKRYFALLTTLHDSYPDVFTSDIRERERKIFLEVQDRMRIKKEFGKHHIAMLEHIGLSFDKPVIREDSAMVYVHGPYRYYVENKAFEFPVNTLFSFMKEDGKLLINGVQDK